MMLDWVFHREQDGADRLEEGYFLLRKHRSGRMDVPVHAWFGPPPDPDRRGAFLDRGWRWNIEINGVLFGDPDQPPAIGGFPVETLEGIWPECRRFPIDADEYCYRVDQADYAERYDPDSAFAGTARRIDPLTATLPMWSE